MNEQKSGNNVSTVNQHIVQGRLLFTYGADGNSHGILLLNSNAMEVVITGDTLSWRMTGGVIDLYVLMGPSPAQVLEQLTGIIGRPALPPLWSLGFHQCK